MDDAFYRLDGDRILPSALTTGPWTAEAQHAGPPSALLVRAMEALGQEEGLPHLARITVEILRPVPLSPLRLEARVEKAGRSAGRLRAQLFSGDRALLRASGLALRVRPIEAVVPEPVAPEPGPEGSAPFTFPFFKTAVGYHTAMELRLARGVFGEGPTFMWMRARVPLVAGEETSPAQRVTIAGDSGNGVSPILSWVDYGFMNPDLTIAWSRPLEGEWVGLEAATEISAALGVGTACSRIHDRRGPVGVGLQTLLCDPGMW